MTGEPIPISSDPADFVEYKAIEMRRRTCQRQWRSLLLHEIQLAGNNAVYRSTRDLDIRVLLQLFSNLPGFIHRINAVTIRRVDCLNI